MCCKQIVLYNCINETSNFENSDTLYKITPERPIARIVSYDI
jgi:hypothetical protein